MRFRKFIERAGYFNDKEDTRPRGLGRQQEMPGITMVPGTQTLKGKVSAVYPQDNKIVLVVDSEERDDSAEVSIPRDQYADEKETSPKEGDTISVEFDREGNLISYDVIHRSS